MPKDGTVHELTSNVSAHYYLTPVDLFALSAPFHEDVAVFYLGGGVGESTWSLCAQSV